jgi:pantoate--beta-alanine ligase
MRQISRQAREEGSIVGLVPTGGCLHAGHISLVEAARRRCSRVVVSIVRKPNPTDSRDDPSRFSRLLEADCATLESLRVNYLFAPPVDEFYAAGSSTTIVVENIADRIEGRANPGEFRSACAHILKLFELIQPAFIYVERLQAQKACMLRRMVRDLNLDTEIEVCPIVREPDGLAVSSRNGFLKDNERHAATALYRALVAAR